MSRPVKYLIIFCAPFAGLLAVSAGAIAIRYRLPAGPAMLITGEIEYQMFDIDLFSLRAYLEAHAGNRPIQMMTGGEHARFYVSQADFKKCWPEFPSDMLDKHYTMQATFQVRPLALGGYSPASVVSVARLDKDPVITK